MTAVMPAQQESLRPLDVYGLCEVDEHYCQSLTALRLMGRLALEGSNVTMAQGAEQVARDDFYTALAEHLKTDTQFRDAVDIEPTNEFQLQDGSVTTADGRSMRELIEKGAAYSGEAAKEDIRMATQHERDKADLYNLDVVEGLRRGELYAAVSMHPSEAMARDGKKYWEDKGYRAGMDFIQLYYKDPHGTLLTATYSVDRSDKRAWRTVFAHHGIEVPAGTTSDEWIRHGIRQTVLPSVARDFAGNLRNEYYRTIGKNHQRFSVTSMLEDRRETIDLYFDTYMRPLAESIYTGQNTDVLKQFAVMVLQREEVTKKLDAAIRKELIAVANGSKFTAAAGRAMESLIRYAVVEDLRRDLADIVGGRQRHTKSEALMLAARPIVERMQQLGLQLVRHIATGFSAGRSYGGCRQSISPSGEDGSDAMDNSDKPQDVFGGKGKEAEEDDDIPSIIRCINCSKLCQKEQVVKKASWRCPHCRYEVDVCDGTIINRGTLERQDSSRDTIRQVGIALMQLMRGQEGLAA